MNKTSTVAWMLIAVLVICVITVVVVLFQKSEVETIIKDAAGKDVLSVGSVSKSILGIKTA